MLTLIFRLILALLHCGYEAYEKLKTRAILLRHFLSNIQWRLESLNRTIDYVQSRTTITETLALERSVERINKLPYHLCIIVGGSEERISFPHLIRMLGWSIVVGIPYVSFYDHDGFLKQNQSVLRTEYEKTNPKLAHLIDWGSRGSWKNLGENGRNGFNRRTRVQIFSNVNGKGEIVILAKNLSRAVTHGLLKMEEINTELLDDKLRLENTPDPDLAFVCGPTLSTYGLLPWHTRTTEFFNLRSHRDVTIDDFTFLLEKYGMCQQRYGK